MKKPDKIEQIAVDDLLPYAKNSRTHSPEQVAQIAASMVEFGWTNPVLIDANGMIVAGHGRVLAARKLKMDSVPCIRLGHLTPTQARAYVIADNKLALNAGWDDAMLKEELNHLKQNGFNIELAGFSKDELDDLFNADVDSDYTDKIDAPVYTPKGEKPSLDELVDKNRFALFLEKINNANVSEEIKHFLKTAACRHFVFNYEKIAEYYCHANKETQGLMEELALVIIDAEKAMQLGYMKLKQDLVEIMETEDGGVNAKN